MKTTHQLLRLLISALCLTGGILLAAEDNPSISDIPAIIVVPSPPITIYLTDEGRGFHGAGPGQIQLITTNFLKTVQSPESWGAEQDPTGHWGQVVGGFQVSLRFSKTTFTKGHAIKATVLLRNVSDKTLAFPAMRYASIPSYRGLGENFEFVVIGPDEKQIEGKERKGLTMLTGSEYLYISNGTQRKLQLPITDEFKFDSVGKYRIQLRTLVHDRAGGNKLIPVTSGEAVIEVVK